MIFQAGFRNPLGQGLDQADVTAVDNGTDPIGDCLIIDHPRPAASAPTPERD